MSQENELSLKIGGPHPIPSSDRISIIADIDGTLKSLDSTGTKSPLGSGSGSGSSDIVAAVVSTSNLSLTGPATVDGVVLTTGQTCLAAAQSAPAQNGPYTVNTAGAWTRSTGFTSAAQMIPGIAVRVLGGSAANAGSMWVFTTTGVITVGATSLTFVEVPGAGALAGLTLAQARLTLAPHYFAQVSGASVQTLTLSGMNGDTDGNYRIYGRVVNGHAGATYSLRPNSQALNLQCAGADQAVGQGNGTDWAAYGGTAFPAGISLNFTFSGFMYVRSGLMRSYSIQGTKGDATQSLYNISGIWTDTATLLTSLQLTSSQVDGLASGSFIEATSLFES